MDVQRIPCAATFDEVTGAWYFDLRNPLSQKNVSRTEETTRTVNLDYDTMGRLLGIEIL